MAIRISTETELKRVLKNFNAKIARLEQQGVKTSLPSRAGLREITDRPSKDIRKEIDRLKRFTKKGAESAVDFNGFQITKFERQDIGNQLRSVNLKRSIRRKKGDFENTNKKVTPKFRSKNEIKKFQASLKREGSSNFEEIRAELYKENYIKALENVFGSPADDLISLIEGTDSEMLVDEGLKNDLLSLTFTYDPVEAERKLKSIESEWARILE